MFTSESQQKVVGEKKKLLKMSQHGYRQSSWASPTATTTSTHHQQPDPKTRAKRRWMMCIKCAQMLTCATFLALQHKFSASLEENFTTLEVCLCVATAGALLLVTTFVFLDYWDSFRPNSQELRYDVVAAVLMLFMTLYLGRRGLRSCSKEWRTRVDFLSAAEERKLSQDYFADDFDYYEDDAVDEDDDDVRQKRVIVPSPVSVATCPAVSFADAVNSLHVCRQTEKSIPLLVTAPVGISEYQEEDDDDDDDEEEEEEEACEKNATLTKDEEVDEEEDVCRLEPWLLSLVATTACGFLTYGIDYWVARNFVRKVTWAEWFADLMLVGAQGSSADNQRFPGPPQEEAPEGRPFRPTPTSSMSGDWSRL
ncbi:unnamed protein product [Notodromas monacha]|uniref:Transmembrane protein n=1 Tax=Notodromas monacha TaxID=399045 RepID=A0A7R9GFS6_9CRUS|nr:unnamed protein product [Notodromas monacha]CAD7284153.1 unnamed protein product [Notodromas monacha]CAG0919195.1 unnamed protein product [Notodromas monacha]CAG0924305.1 unnamed protein product [Notodromas monacha]